MREKWFRGKNSNDRFLIRKNMEGYKELAHFFQVLKRTINPDMVLGDTK